MVQKMVWEDRKKTSATNQNRSLRLRPWDLLVAVYSHGSRPVRQLLFIRAVPLQDPDNNRVGMHT